MIFDEETHTYWQDGKEVPSVTSILAPLENFENVPWDKLQAAAEFGRHVHLAVDYLIKGVLDWDSLDEALVPYVKAADVWLAQTNPKIIASEFRVYNERMRYAGTLDLLCELRVRTKTWIHVIDWKSSASLPKAVGPQTAAYDRAYREMVKRRDVRRACVLLQPTGMPKDYALRNQGDFNTFVSCKNIYNFKHGIAA